MAEYDECVFYLDSRLGLRQPVSRLIKRLISLPFVDKSNLRANLSSSFGSDLIVHFNRRDCMMKRSDLPSLGRDLLLLLF